jgi:hypothetical protein
MKTKLFATATVTATATVLFALPGFAATVQFGTQGIEFDRNTTLTFTFKEDNGWFNSVLSVYEVLTDNGNQVGQMVGNLGGEIVGNKTSFTFLAGQVYTLGLTNFNPYNGYQMGGPIYSTTTLNFAYYNQGVGYHQALFAQSSALPPVTEGQAFNNPGAYISANPLAGGGARIYFEDIGIPFGGDRDYNDFVVQVAPEPITMTGMALGGAGLFAARRRRQRKQG